MQRCLGNPHGALFLAERTSEEALRPPRKHLVARIATVFLHATETTQEDASALVSALYFPNAFETVTPGGRGRCHDHRLWPRFLRAPRAMRRFRPRTY